MSQPDTFAHFFDDMGKVSFQYWHFSRTAFCNKEVQRAGAVWFCGQRLDWNLGLLPANSVYHTTVDSCLSLSWTGQSRRFACSTGHFEPTCSVAYLPRLLFRWYTASIISSTPLWSCALTQFLVVPVGSIFTHLEPMQRKRSCKQMHAKWFISENLFIPGAQRYLSTVW